MYVGQSIHLAKRIREHATLQEPSTRPIIAKYGKDLILQVFVVNIDVNMPIIDFILILEQYLFLRINPNCNKTLFARYNPKADSIRTKISK